MPVVRRPVVLKSAVLRRAGLGAAGLVLLFGAAQLALWVGRVSPATFPLPTAVLASAAG